jgi:hypothetical protein
MVAGAVATAAPLRHAGAQAGALDQTSPLPRPSQPPILTVTGNLRVTNEGSTAVFDRSMLEGLGSATITTNSPWYDGPMRFDGVPMTRVMDAVGANGQTLTAIALNDYSTDIPIADFARFGVLLATRRAGAPMLVSERGPLFIIYPYDAYPELRTRLYYSRSAWSVAQLIVQ